MSNQHTELVDAIERVLGRTDKDLLVNFNYIANLVAKTSSGIPSLLRKGTVPLVKENLVNMNQGNENRIIRKAGKTYFVDRRLAIAFLKVYRPDLRVEVTRWETAYGRGDIPTELGQRAPALLRHILDVLGAGNFRCAFQDGRWYFSLNDVIQAATEDPHVGRTIEKLNEFDRGLLSSITRKYRFFGSAETLIVDVNTAAKLWMILPGKKACVFRATLAELFIRILGGDEKLATEIKEIGEFQESLPENHPLRTFRQTIEPTSAVPTVQEVTTSENSTDTLAVIVQAVVTPIVAELQKIQNQSLEFQQHSERCRQADREERRIELEQISERIRRLERPPPNAVRTSQREPDQNFKSPVPPVEPPFVRFLKHFFALQHDRKFITVADLIKTQKRFAVANSLPEIATRQQMLFNVNSVSVRLKPVKSGNKIMGWSWQ